MGVSFLSRGNCMTANDDDFYCSQFQCRQCQDLLENNLAKKRPIEGALHPLCVTESRLRLMSVVVMVGKKNLEVRPIAVNKGEIVKRILYLNPDTEFIFCAGDDKVKITSHSRPPSFSQR